MILLIGVSLESFYVGSNSREPVNSIHQAMVLYKLGTLEQDFRYCKRMTMPLMTSGSNDCKQCHCLPSVLVVRHSSTRSLPKTFDGLPWVFLFLGNFTLLKKLDSLTPCLTRIEGGLVPTWGTLGRVLFLHSFWLPGGFCWPVLLLFNCTIWACFGGRVGSFRMGRRPMATRSIFTGVVFIAGG